MILNLFVLCCVVLRIPNNRITVKNRRHHHQPTLSLFMCMCVSACSRPRDSNECINLIHSLSHVLATLIAVDVFTQLSAKMIRGVVRVSFYSLTRFLALHIQNLSIFFFTLTTSSLILFIWFRRFFSSFWRCCFVIIFYFNFPRH